MTKDNSAPRMPDGLDPRTVAAIEKMEKEALEEGKEETITLTSTGVILKWKPVPPLLLKDVAAQYPVPPVPVVHDKENNKHIPNPSDPIYLEKLRVRDEDMGNALTDILLAMGTEVAYVPDDLLPLESDEWIYPLEMFMRNVEIPRDGLGRYLAWIKYVAIKEPADLETITKNVHLMAGISFEEVQAAAEGFRRNA